MLKRSSLLAMSTGLLVAVACRTARAAGAVQPVDLRCESLVDPQGIDVGQPRLSWAITAPADAGRGVMQSAYQVRVASSPDPLAAGHGDLWDSGKVTSSASVNVRYAGRALASQEPCYWQVRVWDQSGTASPWSKPAAWSVGLLAKDDWKGKWIGEDPIGGTFDARWIWYPEGNPAVSAPVATRYFRRAITLPAGRVVRSATLRFTADNIATFSVNGRPVGTTDDFHQASVADLSADLRPGKNVVVASVQNTGDAPGPAGLTGRIDVTFASGDPMVVITDASWKAATEGPAGWDGVDFDDAAWVAAKELGRTGMAPWGPVTASRVVPARQLRKAFAVAKAVRRATVSYCGLGWSELYLNGQKVGTEVLSPPLSDYAKREFYVTHDVTALVKAGPNAMGVWLGNGRYFAPRLTVPAPTQTYGYPKLLLQLHLVYTDGTTDDVVSDGSWKLTTDGPITANNEYDGEAYDARKEPGDWTNARFDDANWIAASVVPAPPGPAVATMIDPTRVTGVLKPVSVHEVKPGVFIFDMGQNVAGWCRLTVTGPRGTRVQLRHAERLNDDGTLYVQNLRSAKATDVYTLKGGGPEAYEPRFTLHGFQYVERSGFPGTPTASALECHIVNDDLETAGEFACSNPLLNHIYRNIVWGVRSNYRSIVTDCCQRDERQGWLGDRNEESRGESYLFRNGLLYAKWVGDMADSQKANGTISDVCPNYWQFYGNSVSWASSMVVIPGMLIDQCADTATLERYYPAMSKWTAQMSRRIKGDVLSNDSYGDWCMPPEDPRAIHSTDPARQTDGTLIATTYFYHCLRLMSRYATVLDKPDDAQKFDALAERLKKGLNDRFYKADAGQYANGSATACVLPLAFGMVPAGQEARVVQHVADKITKDNGGHISTGLVGCQWINTALARSGRPDLPYLMATQTTYPSLGYMIEQHATTIWELWNGNTADPAMNSGNHVMLVGDLCRYLYEDVAGIRPDPVQPGFLHVIMRPTPVGDLTFASASHRCAYGVVSSAWSRTGTAFHWDVTVPPNTTATLYVPAASADHVTESGQPATAVEGLQYVAARDGRVEFVAGSGTYHLDAR